MRKYKFAIRYSLTGGSAEELTSGNYDRSYTKEEIEEMVFLIADQVYNLIEQQASG